MVPAWLFFVGAGLFGACGAVTLHELARCDCPFLHTRRGVCRSCEIDMRLLALCVGVVVLAGIGGCHAH